MVAQRVTVQLWVRVRDETLRSSSAHDPADQTKQVSKVETHLTVTSL